MVTVEHPKDSGDALHGSFVVTPSLVEGIHSAARAFSPDAMLKCSVKRRDGTVYSIDSVQDLGKLPIGDRQSIRDVTIESRKIYKFGDEDFFSVIATFALTGEPSVVIVATSPGRAAETARAVKSLVEGARTWWSPIFGQHAWFLEGGNFLFVSALLTLVTYNVVPSYEIKYWVLVAALIIAIAVMLRTFLFDRLVFGFGAGEVREQHKKALRRWLGISLPVLIGAFRLLQPFALDFLKS